MIDPHTVGTPHVPGKEGAIHPVDWILLPGVLLTAYFLASSVGGTMVRIADQGRPQPLTATLVGMVARETVSRAWLWITRPLGWADRVPVGTPALPGRPPPLPVLLLPARSSNRGSLIYLATFLNSRGYPYAWAANLAGKNHTLAEHAHAVAIAVEELCTASGASRVDIVAHDSGGLAAAWYMRHLSGADSVRHLITLGTPWQGTRMALFSRDVQAEETHFGAPILDGLLPCGVPVTSIWSAWDPVIVPASSACPPVASVQPVQVLDVGHWEMLLSTRVYRAVLAALTVPPARAEPDPNTDERAPTPAPEAQGAA